MNQGMLHAWWAQRIPDRLAVISPHGDRTYDDLNADINRLSRALREHGLEPGDAIALMCTNRPEFLEVLYAAQRIGLRLTPINWHLTGEEAAYIVENCEAKAFVCSAELGGQVAVAAAAGGPGLLKLTIGGYVPGFTMYNEFVSAARRRRHRGPGARHPDALHVGHHRPPQGRAPRHRRRERAGRGQLLRLRRGLEEQRRRAPRDRAALPRGAARLLGGGALRLRRAAGGDGPLGAGRDAASDRATRHHPHPHGAHHVPPPAGAARGGARPLRPLLPALHHPRGRPVPGAGEAAPDRVAGPRRGRVLRRHRGSRHPGRLEDLARTPGHRRAAHGARPGQGVPTTTATRSRRARSAWSSSRHRPPPSSTTTATPRRRPMRSAATTSRWATWATWTPRATCS